MVAAQVTSQDSGISLVAAKLNPKKDISYTMVL